MKNERPIEYQMTKQMFNSLLETRKEEEKKLNPYSFVINVINDTFGLHGTVKRIDIM